MVADALGQTLRFSLTPGQRHDITQASILLQGFEHANVIADKGYEFTVLIEQIQHQNCVSVIPCRSNRKPDFDGSRVGRLCNLLKGKGRYFGGAL